MTSTPINAMGLARKRAAINERGVAWLVETQADGWAVFESPPLLSCMKVCRIEKIPGGTLGEFWNASQ